MWPAAAHAAQPWPRTHMGTRTSDSKELKHSLLSALCSLLFTLCSPLSTCHSALYSPPSALHSSPHPYLPLSTLNSSLSTPHSLLSTPHITLSKGYSRSWSWGAYSTGHSQCTSSVHCRDQVEHLARFHDFPSGTPLGTSNRVLP